MRRRHYANTYAVENTREAVMYVLAELRKLGYIARANFSCCSGCAGYELGDKLKEKVEKGAKKLPTGVVFWHRQDEQNFRERGHLFLRFGKIHCGKEVNGKWKMLYETPLPTAYIGNLTVRLLREKGVKVDWNGDPNECIEVIAS